METRIFQGSTMAEALERVKSELGRDAVILNTRVREQRGLLGLRRREVYEITAGKGLNVLPRGGAVRRSVSDDAPARPRMGAYARPTPTSRAAIGGATVAATPGAALMETPAAGAAALMALSKEMDGLKSLVKDLVTHVRSNKNPQVPEELFDHYMRLIEGQVADEVALEIVQTISRHNRPELLQNADFIRNCIAEQIEKILPVSGPITRTKATGPHVVALIGPTGVGKTTTIAKLAAHLRLREKRKVGLITIDTYRIAAIDQLKKYADILGAPLRIVTSPEEMPEVLASMSDMDFVLIDTAGRSPNDVLKLNELKSFLEKAGPDEVHLVLSSTCGAKALELATERFGDVRVDKVIFTKIDEASEVGVVLNVVRKLNKRLSYVTTGQAVPDDIEVGQGRRLAQWILGGPTK
jgi:flagellar biosynthesis protein FlhF